MPDQPRKTENSRSCLLIAMPQLLDPYFFQTTTLLTEFTEEGAMGVVLNRRLDVEIQDVLETSKEAMKKLPSGLQPYWGGPVQPERGFLLHENPEFEKDSVRVIDDLFITGSLEILQKVSERYAQDPSEPNRYRLFLGYAGWAPGQLEHEIAGASWVTTPVHKDFVFDPTTETLWKRSLAKIGVDPMTLAANPTEQAH